MICYMQYTRILITGRSSPCVPLINIIGKWPVVKIGLDQLFTWHQHWPSIPVVTCLESDILFILIKINSARKLFMKNVIYIILPFFLLFPNLILTRFWTSLIKNIENNGRFLKISCYYYVYLKIRDREI